MSLKTVLIALAQWLGALVAFLVSLTVVSLLLPLSKTMMDAVPPSGFLPGAAAFLFNGAVNALILVWAARRSSLKGLALWGQLLVLSFGAQVFMTQIETAYFLSAFPLLQGNYQVYVLVLRGLLTSALFTLLVAWMTGGFSRRERARGQVHRDERPGRQSGRVAGGCVCDPVYAVRLFRGLAVQRRAAFLRRPGGIEFLLRAVGRLADEPAGDPRLPVFPRRRCGCCAWCRCSWAFPAGGSSWSSSRRWRSGCCPPPNWPLPTRSCRRA